MPQSIFARCFPRFTAGAKRFFRAPFLIVVVLILAALGFVEISRAGQGAGGGKGTSNPDHGVDLTLLDKTCKPCEDLYHFASGEWLAKNPIRLVSQVGRFDELAERNRELLHQILETAAANPNQTPWFQTRRRLAISTPVAWTKRKINAATAPNRWSEFATHRRNPKCRRTAGGNSAIAGPWVSARLFDFGSTQDATDSSQMIGGADQGGIGLSRPRLLHQDRRQIEANPLQQYQEHIAKMLTFAGDDAAKAAAYNNAMSRYGNEDRGSLAQRVVERRDPVKTYCQNGPRASCAH